MILKNTTYNKLKWLLMFFVPATITAIIGLGELYKFETKLIVGTISIISTFLGTITKISDENYKKEV